jgi:hypothetical protein
MPRTSTAALFNPVAITLWSVPFSPLFGAWLHIHNWTALGEPAKADSARRWFNALLIIMVFNGVVTAIAERVASSVNPADFISIAVFLLWYWLAARPHASAVRAKTGARYRRRRWDGALLIGVTAGLLFYGYSRLTSALLAWYT